MKIKQSIKFGSNKEDMDELAHKILLGKKTATSSLLDYYRMNLKDMSKPDDHISILDSCDNEIAIVRIIKMEIIQFKNISELFALEEGDGSLANWLEIHKKHYSDQLYNIGKELTDATELVCEWFEVI